MANKKTHTCAPLLAKIVLDEIEKYRCEKRLVLTQALRELHLGTEQHMRLRKGLFINEITFLDICYNLNIDMATIGKMIDIAGKDAEEQRAASVRSMQACATSKTAKAGSVGSTQPAL